MSQYVGPLIDLRALPLVRQLEEFDYHVERGRLHPEIAVLCGFQVAPAVKEIIDFRETWGLAG
jgi:hypothetical protein